MQQYGFLLNQRINVLISDSTLSGRFDNLLHVYSTSTRKEDKYSLALLYTALENEESALEVLNEINIAYQQNPLANLEKSQFEKWIEIVNRAILIMLQLPSIQYKLIHWLIC